MTSLQLASQARQLVLRNKPARLYRRIAREIPKVLMLYDLVHVGADDVRSKVRALFEKNGHVKDERVIDVLLERGYIDLEDTLLQYKQKSHLLFLLEGRVSVDLNCKRLSPDATDEEQEKRWKH